MIQRKKEGNNIRSFNSYELTLVFNNDRSQQYRFTNVPAATQEAAIDKMKKYVARNGWFGNMKTEDIIAKLTAIDVRAVAQRQGALR